MRWSFENTGTEMLFPKPGVGSISQGEGADREEKGAHSGALGTGKFIG